MSYVTPGGPGDDGDYVDDDEWICLVDDQSGNYYYYNVALKTTSWRKPADYVEPLWVENEDARTGKRYYYHTKSKETTWKPPRRFKPFVDAALKEKRDRLNAERKAQKEEESRLMALMKTKPVHSRMSSIDSSAANTPRSPNTPERDTGTGTGSGDFKSDDNITYNGSMKGSGKAKAVSGKARSSKQKKQDDSTDEEDYEEEVDEEAEDDAPKGALKGSPKNNKRHQRGKSVSFTNDTEDNESKKRPQRQPTLDDRGGFWKQSLDPNSGRKYYFHTTTKENTWKKPNAYLSLKGMYVRRRGTKPGSSRPGHANNDDKDKSDKAAVIGDWRRVLDPHSGRHYYFHKVTKEVRWILPTDAVVSESTKDEAEEEAARAKKSSKKKDRHRDKAKDKEANGGRASSEQWAADEVADDMSALNLEESEKDKKKKKKKSKDEQRQRLQKSVKRSATFDTETMGYEPGLTDGQRDARSRKRAEKLGGMGLKEETEEDMLQEDSESTSASYSGGTPWGVPPGPPTSDPPSFKPAAAAPAAPSKFLTERAAFEDEVGKPVKPRKDKKLKKKPSKLKKKKSTDTL